MHGTAVPEAAADVGVVVCFVLAQRLLTGSRWYTEEVRNLHEGEKYVGIIIVGAMSEVVYATHVLLSERATEPYLKGLDPWWRARDLWGRFEMSNHVS